MLKTIDSVPADSPKPLPLAYLEKLIDKKVAQIALNLFEIIVDFLCRCFYTSYSRRLEFRMKDIKVLSSHAMGSLDVDSGGKVLAAVAPKLEEKPLPIQWLKHDGFAGIWKDLEGVYNGFNKNFKSAAQEMRKLYEQRWKSPESKIGAAWHRTASDIHNDWEKFKSNYTGMASKTRDDFIASFAKLFKSASSLLEGTGLSAEEASQLAANAAFQEVSKTIHQEPAPEIPKQQLSPSLFTPPLPSHWHALSKLTIDLAKLTPLQKELQEISGQLETAKKGDNIKLKDGRFNLVDDGTFSKIDTKVPTFDPAIRQGYRAPADTIFTDPRKHTNRWDVSLGLFYNQPNMWTSTGAYAVYTTERGLVIARPIEFDDQPTLQLAVNNGNAITLAAVEKTSKPSVTATGALSSDFTLTTESGGSITYHIVQGSPYNTAKYDKTTPIFTADNIQSATVDGKAFNWTELLKMGSLPAGKTLKVVLNNGASWKIYCASPIKFKLDCKNGAIKGLIGDKPYTGYMSTACLPFNPDYVPGDAAADEKMLDQYSQTVIIAAAAGTTQTGYQFAYQCVHMQGMITGSDPLVVLKYPAQEALRQGPTTTTLTYQTVHGPARAVVGSFFPFEVKLPEPTILQNLPKFKPDQLPKLKEELTEAIKAIVDGPHVQTDALYTPAKILQQHATTLKYGMQVLKDDPEIQKILKPLADKIRNEMTKFLGATVQWDSTWGSIVPASSSVQKTVVPTLVKVVADDAVPSEPHEVTLKDALQRLKDVNKDVKIEVGKTIKNIPKAGELLLKVVAEEFDPPQPHVKVGEKVTDINNEFGAGSFNDKALQWGYVINSASMLAEYDTTFKTDKPLVNTTIKYKGGEGTVTEVINAICRDIANPSAKDPNFPQNRTIDFYTGQYIASGQTRYGDGRNTESTSEAFNCFVGMAAWGKVTGQNDLRDHSLSLAGMQAAAAKTYYQVDPKHPIYLKNFRDHAIIIANLFDQKMDVNTFFGSLSAMIFGIQGIPANPTSLANTFNPTVLKKAADRLLEDWDKIPKAEQHWKSIVLPMIAAVYPEKAETLLAKMKADKTAFDEGTNSFICRFNNFVSLNILKP